MLLTRLSFAVSMLAISADAQRLCHTLNDAPDLQQQAQPGSSWCCIYELLPSGPITGLEFALLAHTPGSIRVAIMDIDPATGIPITIVAEGSAQPTVGVAGWYGATFFFSPFPGRQYCPAVDLGGIAHPMAPNSAPYGNYSFLDPQVGWMGPGPGRWSMRVYCGFHGGNYATYDTGKQGSRGIPQLVGLGFPNTGNPITLQVSGGPSRASGVLLLGTRTGAIAVPPIGTFLVNPLATIPFTLRTGMNDGSFHLDFLLPLQSYPVGTSVACQAFLLDPGATGGVSHTAGLEAVIGS